MCWKMFHINLLLLPIKGHYFLFFGGLAGVLPFLMTIMEHQFDASAAMIGIIYSTLPFLVMIAKPIFGSIADKFQQKRSVFMACLAMMTTSFFTIYFVPSVEKVGEASFNVKCQNNSLSLMTCNMPQQDSRWLTYNTTDLCEITCPNLSTHTLHGEGYKNLSGVVHFNQMINSTTEDSFHMKLSKSQDSILIVSEIKRSEVHIEDGCVVYPVANFNMSSLSVEVPFCLEVTYTDCDINCTTSDAFSLSETLKFNPQSGASGTFRFTYQILFLWICMAIAYIGLGVATSIGDTIALSILSNKGDFGRQRLWGALGWGSLSIISGKLIDVVSQGKKYLDFTPGFFIVLVSGICNILVASQIKVQKMEKPKKLLKNVGQLFKKPHVVVFSISVFLIGCNTGMLWTFLIVYLNHLKAEQFLIGLTLGVQCFLGEIPFFFFSNWFLKRIGHMYSMALVLAVFGLRFVLYYFLTNPWMVLPIELTQGITYGIFFTALATYPNLIAPPNAQATIQGILQGIFEGFGVGVGNLIAGALYQTIGGRLMFLTSGVVSIICSFVVWLFNCLYAKRQPKANSSDPSNNCEDAELKNGTELLNVPSTLKDTPFTEHDDETINELNHLQP